MTDDPTATALLAAIARAPGDDLPRQVLADRLEEMAGKVACPAGCKVVGGRKGYGAYESGGPDSRWVTCPTCSGAGRVSDGLRERAEFIRVQVELARLVEPEKGMCGCPAGSCESCTHRREFAAHKNALRRRETELFDRHKCQWFDERLAVWHLDPEDADGSSLVSLTHGVVARGFVEEVRLPTLAAFAAADYALARRIGRLGTVERVVIADREPWPSAQGDWRWFRQDTPAAPLVPNLGAPNLPAALSDRLSNRGKALLPVKVFDRLPGAAWRWWVGYPAPDPDLARAALATAAAALCRELAGGLPGGG